MRAPPDLKVNKLMRTPGAGPRWIWGGDGSERSGGLTPGLQLFPRHGCDAIASNDQVSNICFAPHLLPFRICYPPQIIEDNY